jgi:hypothetical protein
MAKLVAIDNNYLTITDTVSSDLNFEAPLKDVRYTRLSGSRIRIYSDGDRTNTTSVMQAEDDVFEDGGGSINIFTYLRTNTGA